jgi:hypothetical protein
MPVGGMRRVRPSGRAGIAMVRQKPFEIRTAACSWGQTQHGPIALPCRRMPVGSPTRSLAEPMTSNIEEGRVRNDGVSTVGAERQSPLKPISGRLSRAAPSGSSRSCPCAAIVASISAENLNKRVTVE